MAAVLKYLGPYQEAQLASGRKVKRNEAVTVTSGEAAGLLAGQPTSWEVVEGYEPPEGGLKPSVIPMNGYAGVWEAHTIYQPGMVVEEGGQLYLALTTNEGEAPATHSSAWKSQLPVPSVSASTTSGDVVYSAATQGGNGVASFITSASWGSAHVFRDSAYKDGIYYVKAFLDKAGKNSGPTTFGQIFGGVYIKEGEGSGQVFWGNVQHHGSGQMGLFIGSIQNSEGDPGGDMFAGDIVITDNVGANLYGWRIYATPKVGVSRAGKTSIMLRIGNTNPSVMLNQAVRIEGSAGWENPIIVYSDSGSTVVWDIDGAGNTNMGTASPITSGGFNLGSVSKKWGNSYLSGTSYISGGTTTGARQRCKSA